MTTLFPMEPMSCLTDERELLRGILSVHAPMAKRGVDITYGRGAIWGKNPPSWIERYSGNFLELPYGNDEFDVVVFDPPHIPDTNAGDSGRIKDWRSRYGIGKTWDANDPLWYRGAFHKIDAILRTNGLCLLKFCDYINSKKFLSPLLVLKDGIEDTSLVVEDIAVKARKAPGPKISTWKSQQHLRRNHSYWVVLKKGVQ